MVPHEAFPSDIISDRAPLRHLCLMHDDLEHGVQAMAISTPLRPTGAPYRGCAEVDDQGEVMSTFCRLHTFGSLNDDRYHRCLRHC